MPLKQLVYISRSVKLMSHSDLTRLLEQARARNDSLHITGMLLYKDRSFMQLLEGPETSVKNIFSSIISDSRHINIKKIIDMPVSERSFSQWSMGFHHLNEQPITLPEAYTDFMSPSSNTNNPDISTKATELLAYFKMAS